MYRVRARRLAAHGKPVPAWRQACFFSGLALIVLTLISPLGALADELFAAHMAEHLLIADIGALLLVLGLTGPLLAPLLRTTALGWLRHLAHPVPAFGLWAADLFFWHLVGPHEAAVTTRPSTRCSTCSSSASGSTCGWRCSARCPSRRGSATSPSSSTSSSCG